MFLFEEVKIAIYEAISPKAEKLLKNGEVELAIVNPMLIESEPYNVISLLRKHFYVIGEENSPLFLQKLLRFKISTEWKSLCQELMRKPC